MAIKRIKPKVNGVELGEFVVDTKAKTVVTKPEMNEPDDVADEIATKSVVKPCPKCKKRDEVQEILYGYIDDLRLAEKYYLGGCVIIGEGFDYHCNRCELDF